MIRLAAALLAVVLCAGAASAQSVKNGTLSGTIFSASGSAPNGGAQVVLLTTGTTGTSILTQVCTTGAPGANNQDRVQLVGSTVGQIALATLSGDALGSCTRFDAGFVLPPGEELRCVQTGASASAVACTVTGIVSKK